MKKIEVFQFFKDITKSSTLDDGAKTILTHYTIKDEKDVRGFSFTIKLRGTRNAG